MKTVGEFKKAGLVFVDGDACQDFDGQIFNSDWWADANEGDTSFELLSVPEFAWRANTGLTPVFVGDVEYKLSGGGSGVCHITLLYFGADSANPLIEWRPHLPTTKTKSPLDVDAHVSDASGSVKVDIGSGVDTGRHSSDIVKKPSHYQVFDGIESIQIIASSMTEEGFKGFCFGNNLKYRLRAGGKDDTQQEIDKANFYKELFANHKHLCRKESL